MSEPTRTSAAKRAKLAIALKRNMARRKEVASRQSPVTSETSTAISHGHRVAFHGEPHAPKNARGQKAKPALSCDSTPHGEVSRPSRR